MENNENPENTENLTEEVTENASVDEKIEAAFTKFREEFTQKLNKDKELERLSDEDRLKAEIEDARADIEKQRAELSLQKLQMETAKVLNQRGIPLDFLDFLVAQDNETTLSRIKKFETQFKKSIEAAINEKLKTTPPPSSGTADLGGSSKAIADLIKKRQFSL